MARARRIGADPRRTLFKIRTRLFKPATVGVDDHWVRIQMIRSIDEYLNQHGTAEKSAVEISGREILDRHRWLRSETLDYPDFDVCNPGTIEEQFDVVICNQVLEHVVDPFSATRTLHNLCRPGGLVVVGVPFLLRIHLAPVDLWRFTPEGLSAMLEQADLDVIQSHGWGNSAAVRANFYTWAPMRRWRSLRNEEDLPITVWAFATPKAS